MFKMITLTKTMAAIAMASAVLVTGTTAEARMKKPKVGGSLGYCWSLQNRLDAIVERMTELRKAGNVGKEYNELLAEGRQIMGVWNASCRHAYGSPFYGPPPPEFGGFSVPRPPLAEEKAPEPGNSGPRLPDLKSNLILRK